MDKPTKNDSHLVTYLLVSAISVTATKKVSLIRDKRLANIGLLLDHYLITGPAAC